MDGLTQPTQKVVWVRPNLFLQCVKKEDVLDFFMDFCGVLDDTSSKLK
jgi:hypothetical protein